MRQEIQFRAYGHHNIRSRHKTTLMTTMEQHLTTRGDCIIGVGAEIGLAQLPEHVKTLAKNPDTRIVFSMTVDGLVFTATGKGHPDLTYTDPIDMVARKSSYTCGRTLMIGSDKAAIDIPEEIVKALQKPQAEISVRLTFEAL